MTVLKISHIKKKFGQQEVLNDVSFEVPKNSILGFIGQNGAGKTTLMKMIVGLLQQDSGKIEVCDTLVTYGENKTNHLIGYLPDVPEYYDFMTAEAYLKMCGDVTGYPKEELETRVTELLHLVGLENSKKKTKTFSRGMKQRLGIAQALLNKPKLLICDEPTSALDPIGRKEILNILKQVKHETTVLFSTHVLSDVEKICDHIVLLHEGEIKLDMTPQRFRQKYANQKIQLTISDRKLLMKVQEVFQTEKTSERDEYLVGVEYSVKDTQEKLYRLFVDENRYPKKIQMYQPTLEEIFTEVVS